MRGVLADLQHAVRLYRRSPVASGIVVAVLAIAMAFVTAFLSLYIDQAHRPHKGFEESDRLVTLMQSSGTSSVGLPYGLLEHIADEVTSLEAVAGIDGTNIPTGPDAQPEFAGYVSSGFFEGLRPRLVLGRGFEAGEHESDAEPVVIVSDQYWREELGGRAEVIGTTLRLWFYLPPATGEPSGPWQQRPIDFRIVGVAAPELQQGISWSSTALWLPAEKAMSLNPASPGRQLRPVRVIGRRHPGVSAAAVADELQARYGNSPEEFGLDAARRLDAMPGIVQSIAGQRSLERQLRLFLLVSVLIALVAACNISLFLLAHAPGRRREIAIRLAVGAPFRRIARQLVSEASLLVAVAAALGTLAAAWLSGLLRGLPFLDNAQWREVTLLDWRVLVLFAAFLLILTLLVSLAPIAGLRRFGIAASSRELTGRATAGQRLAGTAQLAIAATVAAVAVAFGADLAGLTFRDPGYSTRNLYAVKFAVDSPSAPNVDRAIVEFERRRNALLAVPGISRASFGSPVPGETSGALVYVVADPRDATKEIQLSAGMADPSFIDLLGLRLVHGRAPAASDRAAVVVNQTLAQRFFGRDDVVGEKLAIPGYGAESVEIIGVLQDLSFRHPSAQIPAIAFTTVIGDLYFASVAVVESTLPAAELEQRFRALTDAGGLEVGVDRVTPLRTLRMRLLEDERARSALTIGAALVVVTLAGFGFHGIQRYLVNAGRREHAIRASLGAGPKSLGRLVIRRGLVLGLPGLLLGALLTFVAVAWLRDDFVSRDISPMSVTAAVIAGLLLLLAAASLGPARQARQTQPAPLLRED